MKKNVIMSAVVAIIAVCFYSCASSRPVANSTATIEEFDYRIVDSKAKSTGMSEAPKWYDAAMDSTTALKAIYPNTIPIVQNGDGKNLEAIRFELETFGANRQLAASLSTYVSTTAGQAINSDGSETLEKALSSFTAVASKAEFSGLEKEADYWLLKELNDGSRIYTYTVLYLMPEALYDRQINAMLNEMTNDEKEVIQPLVDKAKEEIGAAY